MEKRYADGEMKWVRGKIRDRQQSSIAFPSAVVGWGWPLVGR